jgi:hypothetical protein
MRLAGSLGTLHQAHDRQRAQQREVLHLFLLNWFKLQISNDYWIRPPGPTSKTSFKEKIRKGKEERKRGRMWCVLAAHRNNSWYLNIYFF